MKSLPRQALRFYFWVCSAFNVGPVDLSPLYFCCYGHIEALILTAADDGTTCFLVANANANANAKAAGLVTRNGELGLG